jgi:hypothetical protein
MDHSHSAATFQGTEVKEPPEVNESTEAEGKGNKGKVAAVAGADTAVAGIAGGIAVAARDNRRRVLGKPIGKRSRLEETASTVVGKVGEPVKKVGSRFSRD